MREDQGDFPRQERESPQAYYWVTGNNGEKVLKTLDCSRRYSVMEIAKFRRDGIQVKVDEEGYLIPQGRRAKSSFDSYNSFMKGLPLVAGFVILVGALALSIGRQENAQQVINPANRITVTPVAGAKLFPTATPASVFESLVTPVPLEANDIATDSAYVDPAHAAVPDDIIVNRVLYSNIDEKDPVKQEQNQAKVNALGDINFVNQLYNMVNDPKYKLESGKVLDFTQLISLMEFNDLNNPFHLAENGVELRFNNDIDGFQAFLDAVVELRNKGIISEGINWGPLLQELQRNGKINTDKNMLGWNGDAYAHTLVARENIQSGRRRLLGQPTSIILPSATAILSSTLKDSPDAGVQVLKVRDPRCNEIPADIIGRFETLKAYFLNWLYDCKLVFVNPGSIPIPTQAPRK